MRKNRPWVFRMGSSFDAWNFVRMSAFLPAGILAPRPSILRTHKNGRSAALNSVTARSVAVRKPMRNSCRRLTRDNRPPAATEVSSCGRITLRSRREALMCFGKRPRRVEVHTWTAQRRADDGKHDIGHDKAGEYRDHPFT